MSEAREQPGCGALSVPGRGSRGGVGRKTAAPMCPAPSPPGRSEAGAVPALQHPVRAAGILGRRDNCRVRGTAQPRPQRGRTPSQASGPWWPLGTWPRLCWGPERKSRRGGGELLDTPGQGSPRGLWSCSPSCTSRGSCPRLLLEGQQRPPSWVSAMRSPAHPASSPPGLGLVVGSTPSGWAGTSRHAAALGTGSSNTRWPAPQPRGKRKPGWGPGPLPACHPGRPRTWDMPCAPGG